MKGAVVTGAGSGIGRAVAIRLASEGYEVIAADRDLASAEETSGRSRGRMVAALVDVADVASVDRLFESAGSILGGELAVLVNVAGIGSTTTVVDTPDDVWDAVLAVNARGTFLCCRAAVPLMERAGAGSIVNVASVAALVGLRGRAAYCASKGAVVSLTRAMAVDHVAAGVRVNCVCPGTVDSPWVRRLVEEAGESLDELRARQPMGRLGTTKEVSEAVMYLASDASAFVTGSVLVIDGGLTAA